MSPEMDPELAITRASKFPSMLPRTNYTSRRLPILKELLDTALMLYISQFGEKI
jgi:hypothetical protein